MEPIRLGGISLTDTGLEIDRNVSFSNFDAVLQFSLAMRRFGPLWVGRVLNEMYRRFGDKCWSPINSTMASDEDINRLMKVARLVPSENWNPRLGHTHHFHAARLPLHLQKSALATAEVDGLNSSDFGTHVSKLLNDMARSKLVRPPAK